jgi:hypothetical protein
MKPASERKGIASRLAKSGCFTNHATTTAPRAAYASGLAKRFEAQLRPRSEVQQELANTQAALATAEQTIVKVTTIARENLSKQHATPAAKPAQVSNRNRGISSSIEATLEELISEFGQMAGGRFHRCGYTLDAARHEARQPWFNAEQSTPRERQLMQLRERSIGTMASGGLRRLVRP